MFHIALYEPEIPPNTGNIIRLAANLGAQLHLVHPLGFDLSDRNLRRAGLDYRDLTRVREYADWQAFLDEVEPSRCFAISTRGSRCYSEPHFQQDDVFLFGPESRGLPHGLLDSFDAEHRLYVPMAQNCRSLNLANCAALVLYEAWRQLGFQSAAAPVTGLSSGPLPDPCRDGFPGDPD